MNNFIRALSAKLDGHFTGNELDGYLCEYFIDTDKTVIPQGQMESKQKFLAKNLNQLDEENAFNCIMMLFKKREKDCYEEDLIQTIAKMKAKFPEYNNNEQVLNLDLVEDTKHWLSEFPAALTVYTTAENQYLEGKYQREVLDNIRLSLELLLKDILGNSKSLENQKMQTVLKELKNEEVSTPLRNMITAFLGYFYTFQNDLVKHNDDVTETEIEVVFEMTSSLMKFLIRELNK